MKTSFVSSHAISSALRNSMLRMQAELTKVQKEVVTGRVADTGLALGARTAQSVSLARDVERLSGLIDSNGLVAARLDATQGLFGQLADVAENLRSTLTSSVSGNASPQVAQTDALATLDAMTGILNSSLNGEHLFAGINTDVRPLNAYDAPASPAKAAFDAAFLAHFGYAQTDPAAASMSAAEMTAFLTTVVEPQFLGAGWQANWSNATDERITSRIALNESAETSVSANDDGVKKLAMIAATVSELLSGPLGGAARTALMEYSVTKVGEALDDFGRTRARVGLVQARVTAASERVEMQVDLFTLNIQDLEGVDPYEASTKVSSLVSQIETAYALTARIQQLSFIRFLT
jgi:flagellar hook-associated protein 3 FlgL